MQILVEGDKRIKRLVEQKYHEGRQYVPSKFQLSLETDEGMLVCNTLTGEVILLSEPENDILHGTAQGNGQFENELLKRGFIVSKSSDEKKRCEQLRAILIKRKEAQHIIDHYNILPTTGCNARCFYCYESNLRHVNMSKETAERLVRFISENHGGRRVLLSWFGGEPTLGVQQIGYICERLRQLDVPFDSEMVSNAYLFDSNLVKHAKTYWNLINIQITLDGTEDVYNRTKAYVSIKDNAYQRVLRNIKLFLDEEIYVNIRLNMDNHNTQDLRKLVNELTTLFQGEKYLAVYVHLLKEGVGFSPIEHNNEEFRELRAQFLEMQDLLEKNGWKQIWKFSIPKLRSFICMADNPCAVQCTPEGILSKCEDHIYDHTVGTLTDGVNDENEIRWWRQRIKHDECEECVLYPSCTHLLKNCPSNMYGCDIPERNHRIQLCYEKMLDALEQWKRGDNTDVKE